MLSMIFIGAALPAATYVVRKGRPLVELTK
jgi:hypothetical protein